MRGIKRGCIFFIIVLGNITYCAELIQNIRELPVKKPACLTRIKQVPLSINLYLDRVIYTDSDRDGQGLVVINPPDLLFNGKLRRHKVVVSIEKDKKILQQSEIEIQNSDHIGFDIDIPGFDEGKFLIKGKLFDEKKSLLSENTTILTKKTADKKSFDRSVKLVLTECMEFKDSRNIPITTGIPLPEGLLYNVEDFKLLENGKEIPVQSCVRSRWTKKGSIKWLGLDFLANYNNGRASDYVIQFGEKREAIPLNPVQVNETPDIIEINNGVLKIKFSKKSFHLFEEIHVDKNKNGIFEDTELFVTTKESDGPYWINAEEKIFRMCSDTNVKVYLEEKGPLKTIVRADGWAVSEDGKKEGKFVIRVIVYSGQRDVGVNSTFIITWDTLDPTMKIRDLGIKTSYLNIGNNLASIPHEWWKEGINIPEENSIYFLADRWNSFFIKESKDDKVLNSFFGTFGYLESIYGKNYFNWFGVMGENAGIGIIQRHLFQLFPKEIEISRNAIVWHAWPYHSTERIKSGLDIGDYVNLRWLHQGKLLDLQIPEEYFREHDKFKKLTPDHKWRWGGEKLKYYGTGVAITGELLYVFDIDSKQKARYSTTMVNKTQVFENYPHAISDPEWTRKTKVFETVVGITDIKYKQIEEGISNAFDRVVNIISDNKEYGQFIWPDAHSYYIPGGSPPALHRAKTGYHHGSNLSILYLYLRSGNIKYWNFYESFSRHLFDHVSVNYDPWNPEVDLQPVSHWPGAVYHCDGYVPWGSYHELWGHMGAQYSYLIYYYLTGDTRALDLIKEWAESVLKRYRIPEDYDFSGMIDRNPANGWMVATNYYADMHDARFLRLIWEFRNRLLAQPMRYMSNAPPPTQSGRYWLWTYTKYWRDPLPLKLVSEYVDEFTRAGPSKPGYNWPVLATDEQGKKLKAVWCHDGSSRIVDLTIAGPMYGKYAPYFIDASLFTNNPAYIKYYWFESVGLAILRQWAHGHPSQFFSLQWTSDSILTMLPIVSLMKDLGLPEVPCFYPFPGEKSGEKVFTAMKEDKDREFTLTFWGYIPEKIKEPVRFQIFDPDGNLIKEGQLPTGSLLPDKPYTVKVDKDNKTGQYILKLITKEWTSALLNCPISDLPGEVYIVYPGTTILTATRYFLKPLDLQKEISLSLSGNTLFRLETSVGDKIKTQYEQKMVKLPLEYQSYRISFCQQEVSSSGPGRFMLLDTHPIILSADETLWFYPVMNQSK